MTPKERRADGLTIRFAQNGAGGDETILLLGPWIDPHRITRSGG